MGTGGVVEKVVEKEVVKEVVVEGLPESALDEVYSNNKIFLAFLNIVFSRCLNFEANIIFTCNFADIEGKKWKWNTCIKNLKRSEYALRMKRIWRKRSDKSF